MSAKMPSERLKPTVCTLAMLWEVTSIAAAETFKPLIP